MTMETVYKIAEWAQHFNGMTWLLLMAGCVYLFVAWDSSRKKKKKPAEAPTTKKSRRPKDLAWPKLLKFLLWESAHPDKDYDDWVVAAQENSEDLHNIHEE